jgi:hypothetical protein
MLVDVQAILDRLEQKRRHQQMALAASHNVSRYSRISHNLPAELDIANHDDGAADQQECTDVSVRPDAGLRVKEATSAGGGDGAETDTSHFSQISPAPGLQIRQKAALTQIPDTLYPLPPIVANGVARLDPECPRGWFTHDRWREIVADGFRFVPLAHMGGFSCRWADVFGIDPTNPDGPGSGLIVRLRGRHIGMFNGESARLKPPGVTGKVQVEDLVTLQVEPVWGGVMLWDLPEQKQVTAAETVS